MWEDILRKAPTDDELYALIDDLEGTIAGEGDYEYDYNRFIFYPPNIGFSESPTGPPRTNPELNSYEGRIFLLRDSVENQDGQDWVKHINRLRDLTIDEFSEEEEGRIEYLLNELFQRFKFREDNR